MFFMRNKDFPSTRHEIKILITYADYIDLSTRLACLMQRDPNSFGGDYFIRSLYFDDIYNTSYTTKVDGVDNRTKYRIRIYNHSDNVIKFEKKEKYVSKIHKSSIFISRAQYESILSGDCDFLRYIDKPLAKELYTEFKSKKLSPSVIVDYNRDAFVHELSNTRITFDKSLSAGINSYDIFDNNLTTLSVFNKDMVILEVKYDNFLPSHIAAIINSIYGVKMSLSKFVMCKKLSGTLNKGSLFSN